jgi:hypothetical protein
MKEPGSRQQRALPSPDTWLSFLFGIAQKERTQEKG